MHKQIPKYYFFINKLDINEIKDLNQKIEIIYRNYDIKPKNRWYIKPGTVNIIVENPIETDGKTVEELLKETHKIFTNHLNS